MPKPRLTKIAFKEKERNKNKWQEIGVSICRLPTPSSTGIPTLPAQRVLFNMHNPCRGVGKGPGPPPPSAAANARMLAHCFLQQKPLRAAQPVEKLLALAI
ncbi:hypothetical protein MHYP_G00196120 [Metynnis hypsauchen]